MENSAIESKYSNLLKIGEGTYGIVYVAFIKGTREKVAIKQLSKPREQSQQEREGVSITACREIMLLNEMHHENILNVREVHLNPDIRGLYLVCDYAEYDLNEIISFHNKNKKPIPESCIKSFLWQMLNGIHYLHSNWIIHRDLKPANVLVMGAGNEMGRVKIADFGLARMFYRPLRPLGDNGVVVTVWYRAPELLLGSSHYTGAVDVWALGCIFAEMFLTTAIFPGNQKGVEDQLEKIFTVLGTPTPQKWPGLLTMPDWSKIASRQIRVPLENSSVQQINNLARDNKLAYDLLMKMLEYDPDKRINAGDALNHPYFQEQPSMNAFDIYDQPPYPPRKTSIS